MPYQNMRPLKVAIIEPVGGHGGMNYYDFSLCDGLVQAGIQPILYTCDETKIPEGLNFEVKIVFKNIYGKTPKFFRGVNYLCGLIYSLIDAKYNGIKLTHFHFFHTSIMEWLSVKIAKKIFRNAIVITAHDVESLIGSSVLDKAEKTYCSSDIVIVHNMVSQKELKIKLRLCESKIKIIPHGNYLNYIKKRISKEKAKERLGIKGKGPCLLFFGQIKEVKGLDILLKALPNIIKKHPKINLIIAGKVWKDNLDKYKDIIEMLGLCDNITLHIKYIPDDLVDYYFQASDLVVLPYRKIYQSGVLLMAMSYGCPVLVSGLQGMKEVITDNVNGFIYNPNNSPHLENRLIHILSNREKMISIGKAGYDTVSKKYNWGDISLDTAQTYKEVLLEYPFESAGP